MFPTTLDLPDRPSKPRGRGLTLVIDNGVPTRSFEDVIDSNAELIDFVKFGWGTALVTRHLERKIDSVRAAGLDFFFGGTLFEKFVSQGRFDDYLRFL